MPISPRPFPKPRRLSLPSVTGPTSPLAPVTARRTCKPKLQPLHRQLRRIFNLLLAVVPLGLHFGTRNAASKLFAARGANEILSPAKDASAGDFFFPHPEILFLPAGWFNAWSRGSRDLVGAQRGTRLHPFLYGLRMFGDVIRIRWHSPLSPAGAPPHITSPGRVIARSSRSSRTGRWSGQLDRPPRVPAYRKFPYSMRVRTPKNSIHWAILVNLGL